MRRPPVITSLKSLAKALGLPYGKLWHLHAQGVFGKDWKGHFDPVAIRLAIANHPGTGSASAVDEELKSARLRKIQLQADAIQTQLEYLKSPSTEPMVPVAAAYAVIEDLLQAVELNGQTIARVVSRETFCSGARERQALERRLLDEVAHLLMRLRHHYVDEGPLQQYLVYKKPAGGPPRRTGQA
jgi:hypothetical protein